MLDSDRRFLKIFVKMSSKNSEKKINRKQKRCQQILSNELDLKFTTTATKVNTDF